MAILLGCAGLFVLSGASSVTLDYDLAFTGDDRVADRSITGIGLSEAEIATDGPDDAAAPVDDDAAEEVPEPALVPLTLQARDNGADPPRTGAIMPQATSGVLNISAFVDDFRSGESGSSSFSLALAPAVYFHELGQIVLETDFRLVWERETGDRGGRATSRFDLQRGAVRLTRDFPEAALRLQVGDVFARAANFQNGARMLGATIGTAYPQLQPFRTVVPSGRRNFVLERASRVEVYIDGQLFQDLRLDPGQYDLTNFANNQGSRRVSLILRDDAGKVEEINFAALTSLGRVASTILDFSATVGFGSQFRIEGPTYDFNDPQFTGFVRYGVSDRTTVSGDLQADRRVALLGASAIHSFSNFSVGLGLASSINKDGKLGYALRGQFESAFSETVPTVNVEIIYLNASFEALGSQRFRTDRGLQINAFSTVPITENFVLNAGGDYRISRNPGVGGRSSTEWSAFVAGSRNLFFGIGATLTASVQKTDGRSPEFSVLIALRKSFGRARAQAFYDSRIDRSSLTMSVDGPPVTNTINGRATLDNSGGIGERLNATANVSYQNNRFIASGFHSRSLRNPTGLSQQTSSLQFDTAIAWVGDDFALGRPVSGQGFAIVKPFADSREPVFVDAGSRKDYRARSGMLGNALVNDLRPYTNERFEVLTSPADTPPANTAEESAENLTQNEQPKTVGGYLQYGPPDEPSAYDAAIYTRYMTGVVVTPRRDPQD